MKLRKKIGMFFIFACIVPVGIMLAILLNQNAANIREVNKKEVERTVALVNKIAQQELEKGFISLDYLKNVSFGQEDSYQTQNALRDIKLNSANFVRAYIIDEAGEIEVYPKDGKIDGTIRNSEWYKKAKPNKKLIYAQPKTEDSYIVTVSKGLVKGGVVAVDIDLKLAFAELEKNKGSSISNYAILDRNTGSIIFPNITDFNAEFINELIVNDSNLGKTGIYKSKDKGNVSYYKEIVEGTDWLLVGEFTVSALKVTYEASRNILLVSLSIIVFLSLFSVFIFESIMVSPLVQVKEKFKQASTGNFGTRIFVDSNDEIGDLASEFNTLMKKISKKVKTIEEGISKGLTKSQIAADVELDEAMSSFESGFAFEKVAPRFDFKSNEAYTKREIQPKVQKREETVFVERRLGEETLVEDEGFDNPIVEEDENFKKHQRELIHRTFDEWRSEYFKTLEEKKKNGSTPEIQVASNRMYATDVFNNEDEIL